MVFHRGRLVSRDGEALFEPPPYKGQRPVDTVNIKSLSAANLRFKAKGDEFPVIGVIPGQIVTRKLMMKIKRDSDGFILPEPDKDLLKLVVVERHHASGKVGRGLVKGLGIKRGAIASSIAHDSHNIVAAGADDKDILLAIKQVARMQGGLAVVENGRVTASLALPIAGLLSDEPLCDVVARFEKVENAAKGLGSALAAPFAALSFLALPVIPELRLTDLGLVDVSAFQIIEP
jgi:adenine deaminase